VAVVLRELGIDPDDTRRIVEVWNKADLLSSDDRERLAATSERAGEEKRPILISALTGEGIPELLSTIEQHLAMGRLTYEVDVAPEDGQGLAWLHENTEILERRTGENGHSTLQVRLVGGKEPRFRNRFPQARVL
jgi:GTP-binding protein HflX